MKQLITILLILTIGFAQSLSKEEKQIRSYIDTHTDEAIHLVEKVVNINSGTLNIKGNKKVGKIFKAELDKLGFKTYWVTYPKNIKRSGHLFAEMRGGKGQNILEKAILHTVPVFRI